MLQNNTPAKEYSTTLHFSVSSNLSDSLVWRDGYMHAVLEMNNTYSLVFDRNNLQKYFYNEITLHKSDQKISPEYKEFLEKCISIVESHLEDENFSVKTLLSGMGMSHSNLFRKIKSISGVSVNVFIRFIRLRKAAELFITTDYNVNETAFMVGINDTKYFREQFNKLFKMNPSEYIKKYRKVFWGKIYCK